MSKAARGWTVVSLLSLSAVVIVIAGWRLWPIWQGQRAVQNLIASFPTKAGQHYDLYHDSLRKIERYHTTDLAVDALIRIIEEEDSGEVTIPFTGSRRSFACYTLGRFGRRAERATSTLIGVLSDSSGETRMQAARALGWIGPAAAPALPALEIATRDSYSGITQYAKNGILRINGVPRAVDYLIVDLNSQSFSDIALAAEALGNLGPSAAPAVPKLTELLKHKDAEFEKGEVRRAAAAALRKIAPDVAEPAIAAAR